MPVVKASLVTIIAESVLISTIKDLVMQAGATGYTMETVDEGFGSHGLRDGQWESDQTSKMLLVVSHSIAQKIFVEIERTLEPHSAITTFRHDVEVIKP